MTNISTPNRNLTVQGNVESQSSTARRDHSFSITVHPSDSGLILSDPAGYYTNLALTSARELSTWLSQWCAFQRERFKPTGFALVNLTTSERRERADGEAIVLVGDSFYIRDSEGHDLTGALPLIEWEMQPLFTKPAAPA